jgi:hypothetical protein
MSSGIIGGNIFAMCAVSVNFNPASVAAETVAAQSITVPGVLLGDIVVVVPPSTLNAGLGIAGALVTAADTVSVRFVNATAGAIDPAAADYVFLVTRPESIAGRVTTG